MTTNTNAAPDNCTVLPDGSAFATASYPLPKNHWLYAPREYEPGAEEPKELPHPILTHSFRAEVVAAVRYAIRGATMCGKEPDFDPDALVQNAVYALCGPYGKAALSTAAQPPTRRSNDQPIGYLPAYELGRLHSGHDAQIRTPQFGPSALDGDVPVYLEGQSALVEALRNAQCAIQSMKAEAETAAQGDEQMMLEACEQISNEGLDAWMAIQSTLAAAPKAEPVQQPTLWFRPLVGAEAKPNSQCYDVVFVDPKDERYQPLYAAAIDTARANQERKS